jgi:beta-lactamase regulating signal transducer with metallopeptidase domain
MTLLLNTSILNTSILNTSIKVTLIVLAALGASALLRRRSAAVRHFVLAAALACAAATPALRLVAPAWQATAGSWLTESHLQLIDRPLAVFDTTGLPPSAAGPVASSGVRRAAVIARWLTVVWAAGAAASLLVLLAGLGQLAWLASTSRRISDGIWARIAAELSTTYRLRQTPALLQSDRTMLLATWGFVRPKVVIPSGARHWPEDRVRIVLGHELAHIRRGDWLVQLAAEVLRSMYWFNPVLWIACRRLRLESEQACDDAVLEMGVESGTYATELIDLAKAFKSQQGFLPAAAIARSSSLERRVRAMLNVRLNREPITRRMSIGAAILCATITVSVAGFGVSAQSFSTVSGMLVDQFTRGLAGATVTLANPQQQSKYEIRSDASGHYEFAGVSPGSYILTVEHAGFSTVKREGVVLTGQPFQQNVTMQVGSLQETITVSDAPEGPRSIPMVRTATNFRPAACTASVGGNIRPPAKIKDVRPIYPSGVKPGVVQIEAVIGQDGRVSTLDVVGDGRGDQTDPVLADAAATAVRQWEFTQTLLDCQPIDVRMKVHVSFVAAK